MKLFGSLFLIRKITLDLFVVFNQFNRVFCLKAVLIVRTKLDRVSSFAKKNKQSYCSAIHELLYAIVHIFFHINT